MNERMEENYQRIKLNRLSIIETLHVEHILNHMWRSGILTDTDLRLIHAQNSRESRVRLLIGMLGHSHRKKSWYIQFRRALLNPETSDKVLQEKYQCLVDFLDNTLLPKHSALPHYTKLPQIEAKVSELLSQQMKTSHDSQKCCNDQLLILSEDERMDKQLDLTSPETLYHKHFDHDVVQPHDKNFEPHIPQDLLREFPEEVKFNITNMEVVCFHEQMGTFNHGHHIPFCHLRPFCVILSNTSNFCYYYKLFSYYQRATSIDLPQALSESFCSSLETIEEDSSHMKLYLINYSLALIQFLQLFKMGDWIEQVGACALMLASEEKKIASLVHQVCIYNGLMQSRILEVKFLAAEQTNILIETLGKELARLPSPSQSQQVFINRSLLLREQGSTQAAVKWAYASLQQVVNEEDSKYYIDALLCLAEGHRMSYNLDISLECFLQAIRVASSTADEPALKLDVLLSFTDFNTSFLRREFTLEMAEACVVLAEKLFGLDSRKLAEAYRKLSRALFIAPHHHERALGAINKALSLIKAHDPRLAEFQQTKGECCMRTAEVCKLSETENYLKSAEKELNESLEAFTTNWGEYSFKAMHNEQLLGQLFFQQGRQSDGEMILLKNLKKLQLSVSPTSLHIDSAKCSLAKFYEGMPDTENKIMFLYEEIFGKPAPSFYLGWYDNGLKSYLRHIEADGKHKEMGKLREEWLLSSRKLGEFSWGDFEEKPMSLQEFKLRIYKFHHDNRLLLD